MDKGPGHRWWGCMVSGAVACAVLAGCQTPRVILDTPTGPVALNTAAPAQPMPGGAIAPPPGLSPGLPPPSGPVSRDGTYSGTADVLVTNGGLCNQNERVGGFRVRGNSVRYGGFRGTLQPDGGVQMFYGSDYIVGQFEETAFRGQLNIGGRFGSWGCTYLLNLERVGS